MNKRILTLKKALAILDYRKGSQRVPNLLFKKSSQTREESASGLKIIRKISRTDIDVLLVNEKGEEIGEARANLVGSDYGTEFRNLLTDKDLWQQHRELKLEYRGMGLGKDMLVALHEAVGSVGGGLCFIRDGFKICNR